MTPKEAVCTVYQGKVVSCSKEEYPAIRDALQDFASKCIDAGDHVRAQIALEDVRRLDALHGFVMR